MIRFILLLTVSFLAGCGLKEVENDTYWTLSENLAERYLTGDVLTAKQALWHQIRLDESVMWSGGSEEITEEGVSYNLALSYTRLALINEALGQSESSEVLLNVALRYWNETFDRKGSEATGNWILNRDLAQFYADSLDHAFDVRWRRELNFPPTIYSPRYRIAENGTLEQIDDGNSAKPPGDEPTP